MGYIIYRLREKEKATMTITIENKNYKVNDDYAEYELHEDCQGNHIIERESEKAYLLCDEYDDTFWIPKSVLSLTDLPEEKIKVTKTLESFTCVRNVPGIADLNHVMFSKNGENIIKQINDRNNKYVVGEKYNLKEEFYIY
jgi:hypothetical protein